MTVFRKVLLYTEAWLETSSSMHLQWLLPNSDFSEDFLPSDLRQQ